MLSIILSVFVGVACGAGSYFVADASVGWSVFWTLLAFMAAQAVGGILVQKRVKREMEGVQRILTEGQRKLQAKMQRWQLRPPGSIQAMQREVFEDTCLFVKDALAQTETLRKYKLWVPMMERQIATAKLQLNWMVKDFAQVDQLMPKALLIDPTMVAMKMARLYMTGGDMKEIEKAYRKGVRRVRYNGNVLLAATMSWIQVQKNDVDGAFRTLTEALKKSDNETLRRNHEELMNNRAVRFTNSGLGDLWYALLLEEPKVHIQRQRMQWR